MPSKIIHPNGKITTPLIKKHNGTEWVPDYGHPHPAIVADAFHPTRGIHQNTIWQRDVTKMPLHPNSQKMAQWMWDNTPDPYGTGWMRGQKGGGWGSKTSLNTPVGNTSAIAAYVVDSTHPDTEWAWMECRTDGMSTISSDRTPLETPGQLRGHYNVQKILSGRIPLPLGAQSAATKGGDYGMAVYDIGTGIWREYFNAHGPLKDKKGPNGEPYYTATVGGFSVNDPGRDISRTNYATQTQTGQSAVVCMHNSLGFIHADEIRAGEIHHALAFTFGAVAAERADRDANGNVTKLYSTPSWPAAGSDAKAPPEHWPNSPKHGQWGRVSADVDPKFNPRTGQPYNPLTQLLIRAAQKYGLVGTDTNAWVHAFNAHTSVPEMLYMGTDKDPWQHEGELAKLLWPEKAYAALDISDFPWDLTEWAPVDWGRPDVDLYIRRTDGTPYINPKLL